LDRLPPMRRRWLARTLGVAVDELGDLPAHLLPAWLRPTPGERRWPVAVAVVVAIVLQWLLPSRLALTPRWLLPGLEIALLVGLIILNPVRLTREVRAARVASLAMVAAVTAANGVSAGLLAYRLVHGTATDDPAVLLATGGAVYLTNIIAFALWYWELDRGAGRRPHRLPGFSVPADERPVHRRPGLGAALRRLPLRLVHEHGRLQPDRHDAADPLGQAADDAPVRGRAEPGRTGPGSRRQRPQVAGRGCT
jgi:hypothetical protein